MFVIIYGDSGTGKTSSFIPEPKATPPIKGFKPEELLVFTPTAKPPAGTFGKLYLDKKRFVYVDNLQQLLVLLRKTKEKSPEKVKDLKAIVVDDFLFYQRKTLNHIDNPNKFDMYDTLGDLGIKVLEELDNINKQFPHIVPFITFHEDKSSSEFQIIGKKLQAQFKPEGLCNHVFRAVKDEGIDGTVKYYFTVNAPSPAKAPIGFFTEEENGTIPNDARIIYERIMNPPAEGTEKDLENFLKNL